MLTIELYNYVLTLSVILKAAISVVCLAGVENILIMTLFAFWPPSPPLPSPHCRRWGWPEDLWWGKWYIPKPWEIYSWSKGIIPLVKILVFCFFSNKNNFVSNTNDIVRLTVSVKSWIFEKCLWMSEYLSMHLNWHGLYKCKTLISCYSSMVMA